MVTWTAFTFECTDEVQRRELMDWFEENHPVQFPTDRYSVFADVETGDGTTRGADYAWLDRYLYVTVMGKEAGFGEATVGRWERAAYGVFDGRTETVVDGMFIADTETGADDEVSAAELEGISEWAGIGLMYSLAMDHTFRFRSYSAQSPTNQITPHPHAFTVPTEFAEDFDEFVEEMEEVTGVEPTDEGLEFLRNDPADDDRYVYGETYGPVDDDGDDGLDGATVVDLGTGEVDEYDDPESVQEAIDEADEGSSNASLLQRIKTLLGG